MNERTWSVILWVGIIGSIGAVIATLGTALIMKEMGYAIILFIVALLFAIMASLANIGVTRSRKVRWSSELDAGQQRMDELFADARTSAKPKSVAHSRNLLGVDGDADDTGEDEERERAEHGNWE
jgi:hypothetical protein